MSNTNFNIDVTVDEGKYRFTQDVEGAVLVYRHGEPWIEGSFAGINMVIAMACEIEALRKALWLFREFTIRNATQWQPGCGHHHPIWVMLAELVTEMGGIVSGPAYEFIQPENQRPLSEIENDRA